jgi:hypothetical protein
LLHVALALRIVGDLLVWLPARCWGGLLDVAAILVFLYITIFAARPARQPPDEERPD